MTLANIRSFRIALDKDLHRDSNDRRRADVRGNASRVFGVAVLLVTTILMPASGQAPDMSGSATMIYEGFTEPRHNIMVAAAEIGRLDAVDVKVGDRIKAGHVIGQLEDSLQVASVKIAALQSTLTGELEATKAEAELNQARAHKLRQLASEGMARPDELRRAEADLRISLARQLAAEEQLRLRSVELERYQLQLERRKIRSPMAGVVSQVFHQPGEYITPGDPAVIRLLVMDKLFAVFNIPVEDIIDTKPGAPVRVYLRSSSATLDAKVTSIAPDIDGESGTVQIRVELDNSHGKLLAGDRCTLKLLPHRDATNTVLLPGPTKGASRR